MERVGVRALGIDKRTLTGWVSLQPDMTGFTVGNNFMHDVVMPSGEGPAQDNIAMFVRMCALVDNAVGARQRGAYIARYGENTYRVAIAYKALHKLYNNPDLGYTSPVSKRDYEQLVPYTEREYGRKLLLFERCSLWCSLGGPLAENEPFPKFTATSGDDLASPDMGKTIRALYAADGNPTRGYDEAEEIARKAAEEAAEKRRNQNADAEAMLAAMHKQAEQRGDEATTEHVKTAFSGGVGTSDVYADNYIYITDRDRYQPTEHPDQWGVMYIQHPSLTGIRRLAETAGFKANRASELGCDVRYMSRYAIDGNIFAAKGHGAGGTVLIDMSGSMSISPQQLLELVLAIPHGTIAGYHGRSTDGFLWIMAKQGRMMNLARLPRFGGNTVDGPAARWLIRQARPLYWVTDGEACGIRGHTRRLVEECSHLRAKHRIVQIASVEEAVRYFNEVRRTRKERLLTHA